MCYKSPNVPRRLYATDLKKNPYKGGTKGDLGHERSVNKYGDYRKVLNTVRWAIRQKLNRSFTYL